MTRNQRDDRFRRFTRRRPHPQLAVSGEGSASSEHGNYLSQEIPAKEPILDQDVWTRYLPEEVFCTILARLPMSSLTRFRTVCKTWYGMIYDQNFIDACSRVTAREPSLIFKNKEGCFIYEPGTDNWMPMPAFFFQPEGESDYKVADSKGGFVLLFRQFRLMVFNPLNQSKKYLPSTIDMDEIGLPQQSEIFIMGMYVDDSTKAFYILVVDKTTNVVIEDEDDNEMDNDDEGLKPFLAQVYDSRSNSWDMKGTFYPQYQLSIENVSLFDDTLQCLTKAAELNVHYNQLAIYSVLKDLWNEEAIIMPNEQELVSPYLFTHGGKQMLVAAMIARQGQRESEDFPVWKHIIIWELKMIHQSGHPREKMSMKVFEIEPIKVQKEFWNIHVKDFMFLSESDFLYFGSRTGSTLGMINLKSKTWRLLPIFPEYTPYDGLDIISFVYFLFQPRFDLVV